jgi:hypothetical protein
MMGYSGGAIPSLWAASMQPRYAPSLRLAGIAAGGIAANPIANLAAVDGTAFAGTIVGVSVATDRAYPSLRLAQLLNDEGRELAERDGRDGDGCAGAVTNAPFKHVSDLTNYPSPEAIAAVPRVKRAFHHLNLIPRPAPKTPAFFYNEINDQLAIIPPVDELYAAWCRRGARIQYVRDPAGEHLAGAVSFVQPAFQYLSDRFAGKAPPSTCPA